MDRDTKKDESSLEPVTSAMAGETSKTVDDGTLDEAAKYLANHEEFGPMTPEQEKKIVKKIDAWMIPLVSLVVVVIVVVQEGVGRYPMKLLWRYDREIAVPNAGFLLTSSFYSYSWYSVRHSLLSTR